MNDTRISCILALTAIILFIIMVAFPQKGGASLEGLENLKWILPLLLIIAIIVIVGFIFSITAIIKDRNVFSWICLAVYLLPILVIAINFAKNSFDKKIDFSNREIRQIELSINEKFPEVYKNFLNGADKKYDKFFYSELRFNGKVIRTKKDLLDMQKEAKKMLDDSDYSIDRHYWVFAIFEHSYFSFFYIDEGDNPLIYIFHKDYQADGNENVKIVPKVEKVANSLEEYLKQFVRRNK